MKSYRLRGTLFPLIAALGFLFGGWTLLAKTPVPAENLYKQGTQDDIVSEVETGTTEPTKKEQRRPAQIDDEQSNDNQKDQGGEQSQELETSE